MTARPDRRWRFIPPAGTGLVLCAVVLASAPVQADDSKAVASTSAVSPPAVSPPAVSPPAASPPAVSPPAASPPAVSPPAASTPATSPSAASPSAASTPSRPLPKLAAPRGGWHAAGLLEDEDRPAVAYPYNLIDRGGQRHRTLIEGRLASAKDRRTGPALLIVNGNPMPLYAGDDGRFVRPYAFGPGSNSIELRGGAAADGSPSAPRRVQFFETRGNGPKAAIRVIMSWDDNQAEVDLHVITPDGQHAFWANPVLQGGGGLDVDSVDGAGPEMFSITAPRRGTYHLYVNYWGNFDAQGYHFDEAARQRPVVSVRLTTVFRENTPDEKRETFRVPLRRLGELTFVRTLDW